MTHNRFLCLVCLFVILLQPSLLSGREWIELDLGGSLLFPSDEAFKKLYADRLVMPEVALSLRPFSFFSLVAFLSTHKSTAILEEIDEPIQSRQLFIGFGGRFQILLIRWMEWHAGAGGMNVRYHEEAFNDSEKGNKTGFYAETGLKFRLMRPLYLRFNFRYSRVETQLVVGETYGGLSGGLSLGIAF